MLKKKIDLLQEKDEKLQYLQKKSYSAIDIVTNTLDSLAKTNVEISATIEEIDEAKRNLDNTKLGLVATKNRNERIIERFKAMIE